MNLRDLTQTRAVHTSFIATVARPGPAAGGRVAVAIGDLPRGRRAGGRECGRHVYHQRPPGRMQLQLDGC
jgi:hypothetical protein